MGRSPAIQYDEDGNAVLKLTVYKPLLLVAERIADQLGVTIHVSLKLLMKELAIGFQSGSAMGLSSTWEAALKETIDQHHGVIEAGANVDLAQLHRNPKLKSGFVGVYPNGRGWKAIGPHHKSIGQYDTPEAAACRRLLYYREHKLPYGELEKEIATWRLQGSTGDDLQIAHQIMEHNKLTGNSHLFQGEYDLLVAMHASDEPPG
jgi:hypothetical protein